MTTSKPVILVSEEALWKVCSGTVVAPVGHANDSKPVDWKALCPTEVTASSPAIVLSEEALLKAPSGTVVAPTGHANDSRLVVR